MKLSLVVPCYNEAAVPLGLKTLNHWKFPIIILEFQWKVRKFAEYF